MKAEDETPGLHCETNHSFPPVLVTDDEHRIKPGFYNRIIIKWFLHIGVNYSHTFAFIDIS